jgi:hypothetical protein
MTSIILDPPREKVLGGQLALRDMQAGGIELTLQRAH